MPPIYTTSFPTHSSIDKKILTKKALREAKKGAFISDEKMSQWIGSWGKSQKNLPKPDIFLS